MKIINKTVFFFLLIIGAFCKAGGLPGDVPSPPPGGGGLILKSLMKFQRRMFGQELRKLLLI